MQDNMDKWVVVPEDMFDFWEHIMAPDALLAGQEGRNGQKAPGHQLLWAVLRQAMLDLKWSYQREAGLVSQVRMGLREPTPAAEMRKEVVTWFRLDQANCIYSFSYICEALGLDAARYRQVFELISESWALTNGMVPHYSERRGTNQWGASKVVEVKNWREERFPRRLQRTQVSGLRTRGISLRELLEEPS